MADGDLCLSTTSTDAELVRGGVSLLLKDLANGSNQL